MPDNISSDSINWRDEEGYRDNPEQALKFYKLRLQSYKEYFSGSAKAKRKNGKVI